MCLPSHDLWSTLSVYPAWQLHMYMPIMLLHFCSQPPLSNWHSLVSVKTSNRKVWFIIKLTRWNVHEHSFDKLEGEMCKARWRHPRHQTTLWQRWPGTEPDSSSRRWMCKLVLQHNFFNYVAASDDKFDNITTSFRQLYLCQSDRGTNANTLNDMIMEWLSQNGDHICRSSDIFVCYRYL